MRQEDAGFYFVDGLTRTARKIAQNVIYNLGIGERSPDYQEDVICKEKMRYGSATSSKFKWNLGAIFHCVLDTIAETFEGNDEKQGRHWVTLPKATRRT